MNFKDFVQILWIFFKILTGVVHAGLASMDHSHAKTCLVMLMLGFLKVWPVFSFKSLGSITENDEPCPLYCQNSLQSLANEYPSQPGLVYSPCLLHARTTLPITLDFHILKILNCFASLCPYIRSDFSIRSA